MSNLESTPSDLSIEATQATQAIEAFFTDLIQNNPSLKNRDLSGSKAVMEVVLGFLGTTSDSLWDKHLLQGQPFSDEEKKSILKDPLYHAASAIYANRFNFGQKNPDIGRYFDYFRTIQDAMEEFGQLLEAIPLLQQMKQAAQQAEQAEGSLEPLGVFNLSPASVQAAANALNASENPEDTLRLVSSVTENVIPKIWNIHRVVCVKELSLKENPL